MVLFCEMVILVVFNSFNVIKNLKKPDLVARQNLSFSTTKAQYDLDRIAAKISVLSSGELQKHKYLTGEDLGYKQDVIQKTKFEYSPLGKVFNQGLNESDENEGILKRLKNTEGISENQQKMIENKKNNQLV